MGQEQLQKAYSGWRWQPLKTEPESRKLTWSLGMREGARQGGKGPEGCLSMESRDHALAYSPTGLAPPPSHGQERPDVQGLTTTPCQAFL